MTETRVTRGVGGGTAGPGKARRLHRLGSAPSRARDPPLLDRKTPPWAGVRMSGMTRPRLLPPPVARKAQLLLPPARSLSSCQYYYTLDLTFFHCKVNKIAHSLL